MSERFSFASGANTDYLEELYKKYKENPSQLDLTWQNFFEGYEFAIENNNAIIAPSNNVLDDSKRDNAKVESLINSYRSFGHLYADLNPLESPVEKPFALSCKQHGLVNIDKNQKFHPSNFGHNPMSLTEILDKLQKTYCGYIGADFRDLNDIEMVHWLQKQMEDTNNSPLVAKDIKRRVYSKLVQAEGFERFLQMRYLGQKRFSLEGLESLIPLLDQLTCESADLGVEEICLGMAHRGRLNVLINIMEKSDENILHEFEGSEFNPFDIDGDVKYHLGYTNTVKTINNKNVRLYLSPNPSHLEAVNPVLEGFTCCRQENYGGIKKVLPVLLHGDAAFIGQGIVSETLNLSQLENYTTGGTIHIITNNLLGFTTNPEDAKSCKYSSDISKVIRAPVLHVNSDKPEAVIWAAKLASMFRNKFHQDIVIDLIGYRRHGHNETDEPAFTQPVLYKKIKKHKTVLQQYFNELKNQKLFSEDELLEINSKHKKLLQTAYENVHGKKIVNKNRQTKSNNVPEELGHVFEYKKISRKEILAPIKTAVTRKELIKSGETITLIDHRAIHS